MPSVMVSVRGMPWGIGLFLVYALLILAGVGLSLGYVVDLALEVPITPLGLVVMALLAYTIFTITLVLQRKEAARSLSIGLTSLAVPAVPLALFFGPPLGFVGAIVIGAFALVLYRGLRSPAVKEWLNQP
jgi:hypothetical protein